MSLRLVSNACQSLSFHSPQSHWNFKNKKQGKKWKRKKKEGYVSMISLFSEEWHQELQVCAGSLHNHCEFGKRSSNSVTISMLMWHHDSYLSCHLFLDIKVKEVLSPCSSSFKIVFDFFMKCIKIPQDKEWRAASWWKSLKRDNLK